MTASEYIETVMDDNPDFSRRDAVAGAIEDARETNDSAALDTLIAMASAIESDPALAA